MKHPENFPRGIRPLDLDLRELELSDIDDITVAAENGAICPVCDEWPVEVLPATEEFFRECGACRARDMQDSGDTSSGAGCAADSARGQRPNATGPVPDQHRPAFSARVVFPDGREVPYFRGIEAAEKWAGFMRSLGCECVARTLREVRA